MNDLITYLFALLGYHVKAQEIAPQTSPSSISSPSPIKDEYITIEGKIRRVFGEESVMEQIAFCESTFNPAAKNPNSSAKGLYQITDGTWKHYKCTGDPLEAKDNIRCAKKLYDREGTRPWASSSFCWDL